MFFTQFDLFRPTTNRISDVRFCEGFADNGCKVHFVSPYVYRSYNVRKQDLRHCYGIRRFFPITHLWTPFWESCPDLVRVPILCIAALSVFLRLLHRYSNKDAPIFLISRDINIILTLCQVSRFLKISNVRFVFWAHEVRRNHRRFAWVVRNVSAVFATNTAISEDLSTSYGVPSSKAAVTLNPISSWQLLPTTNKRQAREQLGLGAIRPLVVYTGKLGIGLKEIECILGAAAKLPECDFLLTGGKPDIVRHYRGWCEHTGVRNVTFTGFLKNYTHVAAYQFAADVLVSYYTAEDHLVDYNYPQKLTEYMLTSNPIVTPKYRATQDILNERNCIFAEPNSADSLVQAIRRVLQDREYASKAAQQALQDVQSMTFPLVTARLIKFLEKLP